MNFSDGSVNCQNCIISDDHKPVKSENVKALTFLAFSTMHVITFIGSYFDSADCQKLEVNLK